MKLGYLVSMSAAAALGMALAATAANATTNPAKANAKRPPRPVVLDCLTKPQVEPDAFTLTCADANSALTALSWTSWTPQLASATGTLAENDCVPDCASGHFHSYPALVVLWGPVGYQQGKRFSELTLLFSGARPPVFNGLSWVPGPRTATAPLQGPSPARN